MLGLHVTQTTDMLGDNMSVVLNTTVPGSQLKKKHNAIAYHRIREAISARIIRFGHITSNRNIADLMTKPLGSEVFHRLTQQTLFRKPSHLLKKESSVPEKPKHGSS